MTRRLSRVLCRERTRTQTMNHKLLISLFVVSALLFSGTGAVAQSSRPLTPETLLGTGFTYQGQLKNAGGPVNDLCDMQFSLWNAAGSGSLPTGSSQVGQSKERKP